MSMYMSDFGQVPPHVLPYLQNMKTAKLREFTGKMGDMSDLARDFVQSIEGTAEGIQGRGSWAEPLAEKTIGDYLQHPGMEPAEKAQRRQRITGGFQAQTRGLARAAGGSGFFSPEGVAQGAGNAPAQTLASGLADLEAEDARIAREERQRGLQALTSLGPTMVDLAERPRQAYGAMMGELYRSQPVKITSGSSHVPGRPKYSYYL